MRNLAYIFVFVLMACEITPNEDSIGVYPDKIISENFIARNRNDKYQYYHHQLLQKMYLQFLIE